MSRYIYSFDLAMENTGLVIYDLDEHKPVVITTISTNPKKTHGIRLHHIYTTLMKYMKEYPVYEVVLERGFSRFATSTQVIFRTHGLINWIFRDYDQTYIPPKSIKLAITGNGKSTKKQVQDVILSKLPELKFENEDESDAYAILLALLVTKHNMQWEVPEKPKKTRKKKVKETKESN